MASRTQAVTEPAIEVRGLHKSYGQVEAVRGINLCVSKGEVFALLGPNGAGKTTMVEILEEGHRGRSAGDVSVLGYDPGRNARALKRRIGIVLQSTSVGCVDGSRVVGSGAVLNASIAAVVRFRRFHTAGRRARLAHNLRRHLSGEALLVGAAAVGCHGRWLAASRGQDRNKELGRLGDVREI